ncbi:hypothetical protein ACFIQF_09590 [Comamonas sp. J-3]|uniref:hypothetical protein n=1 Tax=Comamonas trifloxystrobinivorans TaxID=3350256 RepID=UPI00372AF46D
MQSKKSTTNSQPQHYTDSFKICTTTAHRGTKKFPTSHSPNLDKTLNQGQTHTKYKTPSTLVSHASAEMEFDANTAIAAGSQDTNSKVYAKHTNE